MIKTKTPEQIKIMQEGGKISSLALSTALEAIKPGLTTLELNNIADSVIYDNGAKASFKTVAGYNFATCININQGLVHGLPNDYKLKEGDLVSIDLGAYYKGFHTDTSYTVEVATNKHQKFLEIGKNSVENAVSQALIGNKIGDISNAMQTVIEKNGYSVSRDLVGHGIGEELHEDPYVPGYGRKNRGAKLLEGMVLAIEVIYQKGGYDIQVADDNWTIETVDGSLGGLFEHTVAITKDGPLVLTPWLN